MQTLSSPLVSIIIPCYNSEKYIYQTLASAINQSYRNIEVIVIIDGATDSSINEAKKINDPRIVLYSKPNSGVSDSRNQGLELSNGDFILFLDSDDILDKDFISHRIIYFEENPNIDVCSSEIIKIDEKDNMISSPIKLVGATMNVTQNILLYNQEIITCPSNYLIRKKKLITHNIKFSLHLFSSADRLFLIDLSKHATFGTIDSLGKLYYRVHPKSMSNFLTDSLIIDTLKFIKEVKKRISSKNFIHFNIFLFRSYFIIGGSYYRLNNIPKAIKYSFFALVINPYLFIKNFF
ncbi:MAG: glycosyltransferase family 2 protein [Bacteroidetes bacterium]|nr:glycosyltransferase family 2 protein [Bacteroidota bacterium]